MEPFTPFASPYANALPSWHHGGHFDRSSHDDSGYASDDSDSVSFLSLDPVDFYGNTDQVDHKFSRTWRHRAAAFVNAQWSRPAPSRACHPLHDSFNEGWRTYALPQPLAFEQHHNKIESGPRPQPTTLYNRENFGREPGHIASEWNLEDSVSPLDFEEHRARVPDALPSLSNRIESETDHFPPRSSSLGSPSPEAELNAPISKGSTTSAQPSQRTESSMRPSARCLGQDQSPNHDAQLAAAWQQLYQDRTELEKERRALSKKEESLLH